MNFMMTDYAFVDFTILKLYIQKFTSVKKSEQRKKSLQKKVIGHNIITNLFFPKKICEGHKGSGAPPRI